MAKAGQLPSIVDRLCVLVVDDSAHMRKTICTLLCAWDIDCVTADNGEEGYRQVLEIRPDLVITDLQMPQIDGYDLLEGLSELPKAHRPRIIVLSGSLGEAESSKLPLLERADSLLLKPVNPESLFDCIRGLLKVAD